MSIKVSDIMLDLETGDASPRDAYIQESMGQVNVSAAIYDAARKIAFLEPSEMTEVIQEAATNAGLPTDRENAINVMYEAAERECIATCRLLYQEAAKIDDNASKPTTPLAGLNKLGKLCGVKKTLDGSKEYAGEFASAVMKNKDLDLSDGAKFLKAASAKKASRALINGTVQLANAFGIDCEELFNDKAVASVVPAHKNSKCGNDGCTASFMIGAIKNAKKEVEGEAITEDDYDTTVTKNDVATVVLCNFAVAKTAKFIKNKFGENGSKVEERVSAAFKKLDKSKVSGDIEDLNNDEEVKKAVKSFNDLCESLNKAFNDSFYSILQKKGSEQDAKED